MRRVTKMFVVALLVGALAVPVVAWSHGWGRGRHMMGNWGSGPEYCYGSERGYGEVTKDQRSKLEELDRKFYDETANLRNEIRTKSAELDSLLRSPDPDPEKVKAVQGELSDLRAKVDEKHLAYELEARKILPELRSSGRYGMGYGHHMGGYGSHKGYGHHMGGPGMGYGQHMGGYGPWGY
jgi:Spy/CpxP family protein refolding chaperone